MTEKGLLLSLLGFAIFAYSYWEAKIGTPLNLSWGWCLALTIVGLSMLAYGFKLFIEGA